MVRKHSILLVFIHGFKGDDGTFSGFPEHLQQVVQHELPHLNVLVAKYPQYETRGDLPSCVSRFRSWLQDTIIDLEVTHGTVSPIVSPSIHTILVGHSMGGIVGADTIRSILSDRPVGNGIHLPFPHIIGMLAFDTPYLGLSPSMFAHGAEGNWKTAQTAFSSISSVASGLFAKETAAAAEASAVANTSRQASSSVVSQREKEKGNESGGSVWGKWGKVAALGGAAAALAGGAAAAYLKRDDLASGFSWVTSHLEFVSALMKGEELKSRAESVSTNPDIGFANLFTSLGERFGSATFFDGKERTFCSIPEDDSPLRRKFYRCINESAKDEVGAHVAMFQAKTNPGYYDMVDRAKSLIRVWVPEGVWMPQEEDSEEEKHRHRKAEKRREKGRFDDYYSFPRRAKSEKREKSEKSSRSGGSTPSMSSYREEEKSSRRKSKYDDREEKPSRRSSKHDYFGPEAEAWGQEASRKSSKSSSRHGTPSYAEEERRRSRHGPPSRTNSFDVEVRPSKERRESKSSKYGLSRAHTMEPEMLVRRDSDRSEKERRKEKEKRSSKTVDLEYNPWR